MFSWSGKKKEPAKVELAPAKKVSHVTEIMPTTTPGRGMLAEAAAKHASRPNFVEKMLNLETLEGGLSQLSEQIGGIQNSLINLRSQLQGTTEEIGDIQAPMRDLVGPVDDVGVAVNKVQKRLTVVSDQIGQINEPVQQLLIPLIEMRQELAELRQQLQTLQGSVGSLGAPVESLVTPLSGMQAAVDSLRTDLAPLATTVGKLESPLHSLKPNLISLQDQVAALNTDVGELSKILRGLIYAMGALAVVIPVAAVLIAVWH